MLEVASSRETVVGCKEHKLRASQRVINSPAAETPLAPIVRRSWCSPSAEAGNGCSGRPKTNRACERSMTDSDKYRDELNKIN